MPRGPIRRAQLIAPFGVGAMIIARDGTGLIACGLEHWFKREKSDNDTYVDLEEFKFLEWRLQNILGVDHFRLPPDYRRPFRGQAVPNSWLTIPFLRFPRWHYCTSCGQMSEVALHHRGRVPCSGCKKKGRTRYMVQVPFVAMCPDGHIQDFPWREWVHSTADPKCKEPLYLISVGRASLAGQMVKCGCGESRSLAGITQIEDLQHHYTRLSKQLDKDGTPFLCKGMAPWLGDQDGSGCDKHLLGTLRSASNVYYASVRSSIFIPCGGQGTNADLIELMERPPLSTIINLIKQSGNQDDFVSQLRSISGKILQGYTNKEIEQTLSLLFEDRPTSYEEKEAGRDPLDDEQTSFRREEYNTLIVERDENELQVRSIDRRQFREPISSFFSKIMRIDRLQETRALLGFSRIFPDTDIDKEVLLSRLWRDLPPRHKRWVPAYKVYGEGIFLEFDEIRLKDWFLQQEEQLNQRLAPLIARYEYLVQQRKFRLKKISPRFVLIHTFAHMLMNQLIFECGYSSASLRERLYVSGSDKSPMAGILIYTAAGDSEGTMGGLVRMCMPGRFESLVTKALERARWCSADPICMEIGAAGGQGPDSCNLAACHNCALVPETACEEFNRFLDRAIVVGTHEHPDLGYFYL